MHLAAPFGTMEQLPRYIEPTRPSRLKLATCAVAGVLLTLAFDLWVGPRLKWVASLPTCESLPYVRAEVVAFVFATWFVGALLYKRAHNIWRLQQSPLPGTWSGRALAYVQAHERSSKQASSMRCRPSASSGR